MAYIPESAKWYLAEIVEQITSKATQEMSSIQILFSSAPTHRKRPTRKRSSWGLPESSRMKTLTGKP